MNNRSLLALTLAAVWLPTPSQAVGFGDPDGVHGVFDTTVSYGVNWRMQDRDKTLVGAANGGVGNVNSDDGNLNYDKGDVTASLLKVTHELDLTAGRFGLFARGYYFYDFENAGRTGPAPVVGNSVGQGYTFGGHADSLIGTGFKMLDLYAKGESGVSGFNTQVRVGNQVLSWGESMFIPNGINVINSVDVSKLRTPGSEIKEALLPSPMLWVAQELDRNTSVEAFAIAQFRKTEIDPRGSFFSTNDFLSGDGNTYYLKGPDQHFAAPPGGSQTMARTTDHQAPDHGEFGVAVRRLVPGLNNTEFGLYYVNYHQRTPILSAYRGGVTVSGVAAPVDAATGKASASAARYFADYPENIHLFGLSFNTSGPFGIALAGEYSYRPNLPLQISGGEVFLAAMGLQNSITGSAASAAGIPAGTEISGYRRVKAQQLQLSAVKAFTDVLRADQVIVMGEAGATYLSLPSGTYFGGYGETTPDGSFKAPATGAGQGFATPFSWGYQLAGSAEYDNVVGGVNLTPHVAFSHAVRGVSPTWNEGVRSVSVGVTASRMQLRADVSYTAYFGGRVFNDTLNTNALKDRAFISANVSYSF